MKINKLSKRLNDILDSYTDDEELSTNELYIKNKEPHVGLYARAKWLAWIDKEEELVLKYAGVEKLVTYVKYLPDIIQNYFTDDVSFENAYIYNKELFYKTKRVCIIPSKECKRLLMESGVKDFTQNNLKINDVSANRPSKKLSSLLNSIKSGI